MGLSPLIEQLISFGDSTLIILDLKGDSNELLASATSASEHLARRTGSFHAGQGLHAGAGQSDLAR
jgi:hypothetical protein